MSESRDEYDGSVVAENLRSPNNWVRLLYIILFAIIFNVVELAVAVMTLIQFLSKIFTGEANERIREVGHNLGTYVGQIFDYLTYHSDDRPFPFSAWPGSTESTPRAPRRRATPKAAPKKAVTEPVAEPAAPVAASEPAPEPAPAPEPTPAAAPEAPASEAKDDEDEKKDGA